MYTLIFPYWDQLFLGVLGGALASHLGPAQSLVKTSLLGRSSQLVSG